MSGKLFVYGTLHPSRAPQALQDLVSRFRSRGRGTVKGRLYDFGAYPGVVLDETAGLVAGEVFLLPEDTDTFARLDDYEGYVPASLSESLYLRQVVGVRMEDGGELQAWIYVYNRPLPDESKSAR